MKIGLVRHFKVNKEYPAKPLLSAGELIQFFREYDAAEVIAVDTDLGGVDWQHCYVSSMPRAIATAEKIYQGPMTVRSELREIPSPDFAKITRMKMPFMMWAILIRFLWYLQHKSYAENRTEVRMRIAAILDEVCQHEHENVLLVCHAALMMEMRKELVKRGFTGPKYNVPENGKLYVFDRADSDTVK
ncbi:histidine phosphatase family protein [Brevibacillus migulae]|uniref:histidine phosphatase family protein n=1 Tax=Brevibacillus migulae TaxID=1644114 RepID=UPI00106EF1CF|nr:histidine phosphatase family protein [Brevibacillus migulae]